MTDFQGSQSSARRGMMGVEEGDPGPVEEDALDEAEMFDLAAALLRAAADWNMEGGR